jgi:toxin YoeB
MRKISFTTTAFEQYNEWRTENKKIQDRIIMLIKEIQRHPMSGTGKPEALKHDYKGYWSRRINDEHRLIYHFNDEIVTIIACKFHYV